MVDTMIIMIRIEKELMILQTIIGISRRNVIMNNSNALAARLTKGPE